MWDNDPKNRPSFQRIHQFLVQLSEELGANQLYNYATDATNRGIEKLVTKTLSSNSKTSENEYVDSMVKSTYE